MLWNLHNCRINNFVRTSIVRKKKLYHKKLRFLHHRRLCRKKKLYWVAPGRTEQWWLNLVSGLAPAENWKKNFRMPRAQFYELVNELHPFISPDPSSPNNRAISSDKKLAIALYYLKDTGSLSMTANVFGVASNTVGTVVFEVCQAICKHLGKKYLYLPKDKEQMMKKVSEFESKYGMVQAFGCIDGTHIPISCPNENKQDYFCYKQFFSLNVQAVCDYKGMFMDVDCRWPGSVHDSKVFVNSNLNKMLQNKNFNGVYQSLLTGCGKVPNYLIGDPAYPLSPYCMKEFEHCGNDDEVIFNNMLRSARNPIECTFGRLKARWSILTRKMNMKLEKVPTIVYACFVLHNYCELKSCYVDSEQVTVQMELMKKNEFENKNTPNPIYSCNTDEGEVVRRTLTKYFGRSLYHANEI